jgi:hypothetical protein
MRREYWYLKLTQALMRSHRPSQVSCNAIEVSRSRKAFSASNENFCLGSSVEARTCHGVPHCPQELSPLPKFGAGRRTLLDYGGSRSAESGLRVKYYPFRRQLHISSNKVIHKKFPPRYLNVCRSERGKLCGIIQACHGYVLSRSNKRYSLFQRSSCRDQLKKIDGDISVIYPPLSAGGRNV